MAAVVVVVVVVLALLLAGAADARPPVFELPSKQYLVHRSDTVIYDHSAGGRHGMGGAAPPAPAAGASHWHWTVPPTTAVPAAGDMQVVVVDGPQARARVVHLWEETYVVPMRHRPGQRAVYEVHSAEEGAAAEAYARAHNATERRASHAMQAAAAHVPQDAFAFTQLGCAKPIVPGWRWRNTQTELTSLDSRWSQSNDAELTPIVGAVVARWEQVLLHHQVFGGLVGGVEVDLSPLFDDEYLERSSLTWRAFAPEYENVLAVAVLLGFYGGSQPEARFIDQTHMVFNAERVWQYDAVAPATCSLVDFQAVLLHEYGHVLGMGHSAEQGEGTACAHTVMFWQIPLCSDIERRQLREEDECGVRTHYSEFPCLLADEPDQGLTSPPAPSAGARVGTAAGLLTYAAAAAAAAAATW